MITNNRKHLTCFFPFLTETRTLLKRQQLPYQLSVLSTEYNVYLSLQFSNEGRRNMMQNYPFPAGGGGKGTPSPCTPLALHPTRKHQWVLPLCYELPGTDSDALSLGSTLLQSCGYCCRMGSGSLLFGHAFQNAKEAEETLFRYTTSPSSFSSASTDALGGHVLGLFPLSFHN